MRDIKRLGALALTIALLGMAANAQALTLGPVNITFDEAISGLPFFNFDSDDPDAAPDVIFSTTDPFGFNTAGPGPDQLFIMEPGLEGGTLVQPSPGPDLTASLLKGATGAIQFGFATIASGQVTATAYNAADVPIGTTTVEGTIFDLDTGMLPDMDTVNSSVFPENEVILPLSGIATRLDLDFQVFDGGFNVAALAGIETIGPGMEVDGRYIIDNFTYTPSSEDVITMFDGALPENPLLPGSIGTGPNGEPVFEFDLDIIEGGLGNLFPIFIDPDVAVGYDYQVVSGPNFSSVLVPAPLPSGDGTFILELPGFGMFDLFAGTTFDLLALDPLGFDSFTIRGIDPGENLDPNDTLAFVTGITHVSGGQAQVTMTPIIQSINGSVPAPASIALLGIGLISLRLRRRQG